MLVVVTALISIAFYLFSSIAFAKSYGATFCNDSQFFCYKVKRGDTWDKLFPQHDTKDLVMRLNRINIRLHPGMQIAIPKHIHDTNMMDYAPFPLQIEAPGQKVVFVSLKKLAWGAYSANGTLEYWGPVSGGKGYCPDIGRGCHTPSGHFTFYTKKGAGCVSSKFPVGRGGAPMPYCVFFHGGLAMHGSYEVPGYNDSHGCVRMFVNDAKWLNEEFVGDERNIPVIINN